MTGPAHDPDQPVVRRDDRELETPDYLGRPMPGTGATQNMGLRLGMPGCLLTFLGAATVLLGIGHGSATSVIGGVIILVFGVAVWAAAVRADMRRERDR